MGFPSIIHYDFLGRSKKKALSLKALLEGADRVKHKNEAGRD